MEKTKLIVETTISAPIEKIWAYWTQPSHIEKWNHASEDWHTPHAENDPRTGGKFLFRMEAKDGSFGFDFTGTYDQVKEHELIAYSIGDGRKVEVVFSPQGHSTNIVSTFEAENMNPVEMQQAGWQAILNNFKKYVDTSG
jgi:uncharacterized protein YndB with AHSA1/START domain